MPPLSQVKDWFLQILYKRIIFILIILFFAGILIAVTSMSNLSSKLIESQALHSATLNAQTIKDARSLYTTEVVERAQKVPGIEVIHDYPNKPGAIPIPATYLIQLSHLISEKSSDTSIRIYSQYPFPWRKTEGGPKDDFEKEALQYLEQYPQRKFYRIENLNGLPTMRYAEPDIMKASCVACHNSHPDSPKRDWQVGQLRGVIEINQPLDSIVLQSRNSLSQTFFKLGTISILALLGLTLVIGRLNFINKELDILVKKRTAQLHTTATELKKSREQITQLMITIDREKCQKAVNEVVNSDDFDWIVQQGKKWRQENQD